MLRFAPLTIYLDSNVVFSACYDPISPFLEFWQMADVAPVVSLYAIGEITRNIETPGQQLRFDQLIARTRLVSDTNPAFVPDEVRLVEKDRPMLAAAIAASVDYLVTGDKKHFGHLYSKRAGHVYVILPADFLTMHRARLLPGGLT